MGEIEWAMWANEQAVIGALILLIGGIVGVAGQFNNWEFAAAAIPMALLLLFIEWPRSKRKKGHTIERKFQQHITPLINALGLTTRNYFIRFVLHVIFSVPCCFLLPTILGGMCLMISSIIYLVAALKGEEWKPAGLDKPKGDASPAKVVTGEPPARPPPRPPVRRDAAELAGQEQTHY